MEECIQKEEIKPLDNFWFVKKVMPSCSNTLKNVLEHLRTNYPYPR